MKSFQLPERRILINTSSLMYSQNTVTYELSFILLLSTKVLDPKDVSMMTDYMHD